MYSREPFENGEKMTPVFQTIADHNPSEGRYGNCTQASVASILDLPLDEVPHFCVGLPQGTDGGIEESRRINEWLKTKGLALFELAYAADSLEAWREDWDRRDIQFYHLLSGISPRGFCHCTVGLNGKVIHDPSPYGGELKPLENGTFGMGIITAMIHNPLRMVKNGRT